MFYFAFGSNLDPEQMRTRCPEHRAVGVAVLRDHRLAFPRFSRVWGGGVASPQLAHGHEVWGALHEISEQDLAALDAYESFRTPGDPHNRYERKQITVELVRTVDGSVPRRVRAWIYEAHPSNPSPPSQPYLDAILRGARHHRLPDEYIARLAALPVRSVEPEAAGAPAAEGDDDAGA
jgi:gamma-glutamylcyclotransferase (GGCT)/AIG2-like uncharacterized protein YtfP